jgi:hypothetical protein
MNDRTRLILEKKIVEEELVPRYASKIRLGFGRYDTGLANCLLEPEYIFQSSFTKEFSKTHYFFQFQKDRAVALDPLPFYKMYEVGTNLIALKIIINQLAKALREKPRFALTQHTLNRIAAGALGSYASIFNVPTRNLQVGEEFEAYSRLVDMLDFEERASGLDAIFKEMANRREQLLSENMNASEEQLLKFRLRGGSELSIAEVAYKNHLTEIDKQRTNTNSKQFETFLECAQRAFGNSEAVYRMPVKKIIESFRRSPSASRLWMHIAQYKDEISDTLEKMKSLKMQTEEVEKSTEAIRIDPKVLQSIKKELDFHNSDYEHAFMTLRKIIEQIAGNYKTICSSCGVPLEEKGIEWVTDSSESHWHNMAIPSCSGCVEILMKYENGFKNLDELDPSELQKLSAETIQYVQKYGTQSEKDRMRNIDKQLKKMDKFGIKKVIAQREVVGRPLDELHDYLDLAKLNI